MLKSNFIKLLLLCLLFLSCVVSKNVYAIESQALKIGSRVRVTTADVIVRELDERAIRRGVDSKKITTHFYTGDLVSITSDSILIKNIIGGSFNVSSFSLSQIKTFEESVGSKGNSKKGAVIGGSIFFVGGVIFGASYEGPKVFSTEKKSSSEKLRGGIMGGILLGGVGALIGAGVGSLFKSEKWNVIPKTDWKLSFVPINKQDMGILLSIKF